ncbi:hypothetical protein DFH28DRAFT_1057724 [Melampsora americana]|nr:hypothetical protein DFH28DRAFT_1057724 [Melampsora americana]
MDSTQPTPPPPILITVYAIHDFQAENPDELSFVAGEPIGVTEKDDQYGDGWWQGRNTKGAYGLFPQAYTSPQPTLPGIPDSQPTMNETLFDVQKAIDQLHHPPSSTVSLTNGIPSSLLAEHPSSTNLNADHSEDEDDRTRSDHHLTWDADNGGAAKARTALAEKAKADALAHQLVMDRLKSASHTLYSHPGSASSSRVSIPELNEMDLSEESGDDEDDRIGYSSRAQHQLQGPSRSKNQNDSSHLHHSSSLPGTPEPREKPTDRSGVDHDHEPSRFASGPFSAAAIALGLAHSPVASSKSPNSSTHARNHSLPHQTHRPGQLSSSSILSELSAGARGVNSPTPPIASTLRMSREFSQQTYQAHPSDRTNSASPALSTIDSAKVSAALQTRSPASQDKTPTPVFTSTFPDSQPPPTHVSHPISAPLASPGSTQEHLKSPTGLMPGSSDLIEPVQGRQRSASSVGSGIFFRQQTSSPLRPHSPANSAAPITSTNINTSNSTADSSSAQGSRSRSSSRLAAIEDQLVSPATSTFPSVTGKHQIGAGSFSSILNGTGVKSTFSDPREWTVADVMEWGKTKGLDEVTISKFSEHEITGDVLLELDTNSLKEIDLVAFGRRVKVTKAIEELRKALSLHQQGISSPFPNPDSIKSPSSPFDTLHGLHNTHSDSSTHRRSESATDSTRPGRGFVTPDMPDPISPVVNQRVMIPSNLGDMNAHEPELAKPHSVKSGQQTSLPGVVTEVKKTAAFSGLNHKPEADVDSSFTSDPSPNWQPTRPSDVAPDSIEHPPRPHSADFYRDPESASLSPDNLAEKAELHDDFNPTPLVIEESANAKKSRKSIAKQAKQQRPGTANSILSKKPFSNSDGSIEAPSSPERTTSARPSAEGKSRTSFLGNLRGRKPPPQLSTAGSPSNSSPTQKLASPVSANPSDGVGNKSRGLFTFGHHNQPVQQIQHLTPILQDQTSKESIPKFSVDDQRSGTTKTASERIGTPDHVGWMRKKGEKYPTWKMRYFILKNSNLYYLKSENEVRIKGLIKLGGYKVVMDDDVNPGRYGFKIIHDDGSSHAFSADDSKLLRDWMKAMMKATIDRDWLAPVISSCNIPTMPISEAQKMFPPPRPPSPASRARAQKARLAANPDILSTKDPAMLLNLQRLQQQQQQQQQQQAPISPPESLRPKRSIHRKQPNLAALSSPPEPALFKPTVADQTLMNWINTTLARSSSTKQRIQDFSGSLRSGLVIVKLIESLTDSKSRIDFENYTGGDRMDLYFAVFDYLNSQRIPLEGYALNDMISGDPVKNREFLSRVYTKFNRSRPAFVTAAL